ncbi:VapC toxin family PIN domain ribonuclease [Rhodoplanes elegans]|uniref:Ribonuclease VapC n=1 Tax=Rhodoplanes elegans TaxID=29408 RepID=A0A327K9G4_9BRAD|nr:type II toxin-antitoxin system VapC family toxin [Rhodoplanes elegans]MBK5960838.1 VapC toxin family PIN domain ribonuclease [Rhodoplanes elegans]RAI35340.1 VapC toxin family PIN domain ribonuclease [Rhodoplanes elegans]
MIAVDTSALLAIALDEPEAEACQAALEAEDEILISAGTVAEALIVGARHGVIEEIERMLDELGIEVVTVTAAAARRIGEAHRTFGKGVHPAGLNFGDCFAYEVAKEHACRLLYIGNDFAKTDIQGVL